MAKYQPQIKLSNGQMEDLELNAQTLNKKESSYYLDYNNFNNKPHIPTKTSELENDSGFTTGGSGGGATDEQVMQIIENNSKETDTLEIGTSSNYNVASDTQIPTTKTVQSIVNMALGDIESLLEAI